MDFVTVFVKSYFGTLMRHVWSGPLVFIDILWNSCFESNKLKLKLSFLCIVQYIYSLKQVSIKNSQTTKESIPCLNKIMDRKSVSACVSYKCQITMYSHSGGFSRHDFVIHKSLIGTCYNKFVRHK